MLNTKGRTTWGDLYGDNACKPHGIAMRADADREHLKIERRRQRRQDKNLLRNVTDWDNYSHPRHPFDAYGLPSW